MIQKQIFMNKKHFSFLGIDVLNINKMFIANWQLYTTSHAIQTLTMHSNIFKIILLL